MISIAHANDVVLVLDGDDILHHPKALTIVNQKYLDTNAWFTYGSYTGKWSDQIIDLSSDIRQHHTPFLPRKHAWVYGHPRTFKTFLLDHITKDDFNHIDGTWLTKGTDRGFIYRMLELAGPSKIGYIATPIYTYNYSPKTSTLATTSKEKRLSQLTHIMETMPRSPKLTLPLHVVLMVWQRIHLLKYQLMWLANQTLVKQGREIHIHLVNNNLAEVRAIESAIKEFGSHPGIKITLVNTDHVDNNFARFVYVAKLRRSIACDQVVFLDDDQYWPEHHLVS